MNEGQIIINAVVRAGAIEDCVKEDGANIFVWSENAAEQIEAALREAGYKLVKTEEPTKH